MTRSRRIQGRAPNAKMRQERGKVPLTADLIQGMVDKYLMARFDKAVPSPPFHRDMWEMYASEHEHVACVAPRDHAKSTAGTHSCGLTSLLFRHRDNCMIVSNTEEQASIFLKEMKSECENNEELVEDFGVVAFEKDNDTEWICVFDDKHKFRVTAYGSEQQVRGTKWEGKRPNLILLDDFENKEQMKEEARRKKILEIFLDDIIPAGSADCLIRAFGTILHDDSVLSRLSKDPTWYSRIWRAHKSFDDFSGLLWPEKWPAIKLYKRRQLFINQGNSAGYSQEYLNDPQPQEIALFKVEYFQPMRESMYDLHHRRRLTYYAAGDLATGTQSSDYGVIVVVGIDEMGYMYVVDVRRGRFDTKEYVEQMFQVQELYHPDLFALEKGGLEKAIGPWLNAEMLAKSTYINLEAIAPTRSKESRATSIIAKMKARHVYFDKDAEWYAGFEEELKRFPRASHDDQVDAFAYIGLLLDRLSAGSTEEEHEEEEYEEKFGQEIASQGQNAVTGY